MTDSTNPYPRCQTVCLSRYLCLLAGRCRDATLMDNDPEPDNEGTENQ